MKDQIKWVLNKMPKSEDAQLAVMASGVVYWQLPTAPSEPGSSAGTASGA